MKKRRITTKSIRRPASKRACGPKKCKQTPLLQDPVIRLSIWSSLAIIFIVAVVLLV